MFPQRLVLNIIQQLFALWSLLVMKTFSANFQGFPTASDSETCGVPRLCYSCASTRFVKNWDIYKQFFRTPANFTPFCDPRMNFRRVPLIECKAPCLTLIEPVFLMGRKVGDLYYRGCFDKIFKSRDVEDVALEYLIHSGDKCQTVPRNILYNQNKLPGDNITLCSCVCNKCNVYPDRINESSKLCAGFMLKLLFCISFLIYNNWLD